MNTLVTPPNLNGAFGETVPQEPSSPLALTEDSTPHQSLTQQLESPFFGIPPGINCVHSIRLNFSSTVCEKFNGFTAVCDFEASDFFDDHIVSKDTTSQLFCDSLSFDQKQSFVSLMDRLFKAIDHAPNSSQVSLTIFNESLSLSLTQAPPVLISLANGAGRVQGLDLLQKAISYAASICRSPTLQPGMLILDCKPLTLRMSM